MIRLRISGDNFDDLARRVEIMAHPDLSPLAEEVRGIMIEDNRLGVLAGTDSFGDAMTPLEPSTWRNRSGTGPPLAPEYGTSPVVADYQVRIEPYPDRTLVIGEWPNTPWVHFHASGYTVQSRRGPVAVVSRDIVGLRPEGQAKVAQALEAFATKLVGG